MSSVILPSTLPEAHASILKLTSAVEQFEWRIKQLEKQLYGPSADRVPEPETLSKEQVLFSLFPAPAAPALTANILMEDSDEKSEPRQRRQPAVRVLETVIERIEPQEKICPHCGKEKCEIGCETSERFEYVPAKIVRHEIIRPKLACPCGQGTVSIAPLPPSVVDKGMPGPALVAHVIISKFEDHLPLDRQGKQFERLGVYFPQQTLGDWVERGAQWLQPLVRQMKAELLAGDYLQVDETWTRVMDPEVKGRCATGWLWVASRPGGDVVFEFHPGRGKDYAKALLDGFAGYLQRDGYGVYGSLAAERPELRPVGCWAHARRKFIDAIEERPSEVGPIITELRKLYQIERRARDETLDAQARFELRREMATPILAGLKLRLEAMQPACLPQSPTGKAVRYALNEWPALVRYLEDGRLEIDNNLTENAIRPSAVGKKNWLFIGHPDAGWRSAVIYSIIASCRRHGVDPWEYMKDMFTRLPSAKNHEIPNLVPSRWRATTAPIS
jgi:transposase